ncbi:DMSO reductase [Desulfitobacterium hafniense]|uniref:DMSO reductase n=1 Tax=Desulfitobacterium hafniense TaxID=49338 RepID=A0A0W1JFI3_DESHA|nr:DmsC/YnfH family molybdoenzyme membrane anchor subunit [Desulfitobacterium hafniense]KTE90304.1 DMSO reductase [Desulfitobacterium hafniense]
MEELALIIFTICVQAAIGIIVFATIAKYLNKEGVFKVAIVTAAGLAVIGLLASFLHLGQPLLAINSLTQFATSWLSREIWLTSAFTGLTVMAALLILFKPAAKGAIQALVALAALIGLVDVYAMAAVYTSTSIPAWHSGSITIEFYASALSMGAVLFLALSGSEGAKIRQPAVIIIGIAVALQVVSMVTYYIQLGTSSSLAAQQSLILLSGMSGAMIVKWLFILLGTGLLFFPIQRPLHISASGQATAEVAATGTATTSIYAAAALLIIGQSAGRYLFYSIMIISRVGLS